MLQASATYDADELQKWTDAGVKDPAIVAKLPKMLEAWAGNCVYPGGYDALCLDVTVKWKAPIDFAGVKVPTLICHGDKDKTIPYSCAEAASAIPGSEVHKVEGGSHILALHPDYA